MKRVEVEINGVVAQAELNEAGRLEKISSSLNETPPYLLELIQDRLLRRNTP